MAEAAARSHEKRRQDSKVQLRSAGSLRERQGVEVRLEWTRLVANDLSALRAKRETENVGPRLSIRELDDRLFAFVTRDRVDRAKSLEHFFPRERREMSDDDDLAAVSTGAEPFGEHAELLRAVLERHRHSAPTKRTSILPSADRS